MSKIFIVEKEDMDDLVQRLIDAENEVCALEDENDDLKTKIELLNDKIKELEDEKKMWIDDSCKSANYSFDLEEENEKLKEKIKELEKDVDYLNNWFDALKEIYE